MARVELYETYGPEGVVHLHFVDDHVGNIEIEDLVACLYVLEFDYLFCAHVVMLFKGGCFLAFMMPSGAKVGNFHLKVKNNAENFQAKGIPKYRGCHENVAKTLLHLLNHLIFGV